MSPGNNSKLFQAVLLFLLLFINDCISLKSVIIRVPTVVKSGDAVTLACDYDLEHAALYTIKWYRNDEEFYRFVPKESPPSKAFAVQHINVDISRSGAKEVTLQGVRRELTGDYKCEISADAPLFHTEIRRAHMIIAELPSGMPVLNIEPSKVEIGKKIKADCSSPGSDPPANLTWYINDEQFSEETEDVKLFPALVQTDNALSLHSSKAQIEITASRSHFIMGRMTLSCKAQIYSLWEKVAEAVIRDETPLLAPVLGSTSSQSHSEDNPHFTENNCVKGDASYIVCLTSLMIVLCTIFFLR